MKEVDIMRGKKTDNETIYKVMVSVFSTNNYNDTAKLLNLPESTVRKIYNSNKDKEEFAKLCIEKKGEFVKKADSIINKATDLLEKRLTTALEKQNELDLLLDTVYDVPDDDLTPKEKLEIAKKISKIQLNSLSEITTALGTIYDKKALSEGNPTSNDNINIKIELDD